MLGLLSCYDGFHTVLEQLPWPRGLCGMDSQNHQVMLTVKLFLLLLRLISIDGNKQAVLLDCFADGREGRI